MYNIGIVGTSFIAKDFLDAIALHPKASGYAIYSRTNERGEEFKKGTELEKVYTNYEAMLQDENINIIYIASPNGLHYEQAMLAIKRGKHVLIEKPIATKPSHIEKLYELAAERGVFIMEAYVALKYNTMELLDEWIDELGEIGKVDFHLEKQTRHFNDYINGKHVNVFDGKMGGGAIRDLGPYTIYPLIHLFDNPMQTHYFSTKNELNADETTLVLAHYETFTATITNSKVYADIRPSIISGDNGYIEINNINMMSQIKMFDVNGNLLKQAKANYDHRMLPQLEHMVDVLESGKLESDLYTKELALSVHTIISNNFIS